MEIKKESIQRRKIKKKDREEGRWTNIVFAVLV
jgi:hypothetical protein